MRTSIEVVAGLPALSKAHLETHLGFVHVLRMERPSLVCDLQEVYRYLIDDFLIGLRKLAYAPKGLRACNDLIDHYSSYDLQKVHSSLNEAISENNPDIVEKNSAALSEILDDIWNDKTISQRIKGLKIGVPLSLAAIGEIAAGSLAGIGGLLAGLGFDVINTFLEANTEGLDEKISKMFSRSYQVNIYNFKKKYEGRITSGSEK